MNERKTVAYRVSCKASCARRSFRTQSTYGNRVEVLAADIRHPLEAGASIEPGQLRASAAGRGTLEDLVKAGIGNAVQVDGYGILDIAR